MKTENAALQKAKAGNYVRTGVRTRQRSSRGILKELKGSLLLEGIEVSDTELEAFAAEFESAKGQLTASALVAEAMAKFK